MTLKISNVFILSFMTVMSYNLQARYKEIPLQHLQLQTDHATQKDFTWDYKVFNKKDCKKYLKSGSILRKGYQPIQITVKNSTSHDIIISPQDFATMYVPALHVAEKLHRNNLTRGLGFASPAIAIGLPMGALFVYAIAMTKVSSYAAGNIFTTLFIPALIIMSPFIITAIVQGVGAQDFNDTIDEILCNKELRKQTVAPGQTISGVIFIPKKDVQKSMFAKAA
ncbi:hypothetical protein [Candidatus Chromulinivorax destructor]|uniref:Uncharacterized protein n=1 Tax=Candidatus Chromulinivorax destructor TaxID=2066483 RepID=A0A345ZCV5_9BACT|nr:hypothetical protein [Candidatus Chromulinivorax destructor]AXK61122.1 hypothetical protein C0J27_05315 [Candidatus Chromulinivorax destructor]